MRQPPGGHDRDQPPGPPPWAGPPPPPGPRFTAGLGYGRRPPGPTRGLRPPGRRRPGLGTTVLLVLGAILVITVAGVAIGQAGTSKPVAATATATRWTAKAPPSAHPSAAGKPALTAPAAPPPASAPTRQAALTSPRQASTPASSAASELASAPARRSAAAAPTRTMAVAPPPPPATTAPAGCHPLTSSNKCYKAGETCRDSDHGASGIAGNGEPITCVDNNGWRWEPA